MHELLARKRAKVGEVVRSTGGILYEVEEVMTYLGRVTGYGVKSLETGLVNFLSTEQVEGVLSKAAAAKVRR